MHQRKCLRQQNGNKKQSVEYVKSIQKDFDGSKIQYSDEYYEVTGIENPKGTNTQDKHLVEFEPVVFEFNRKQDSD